MIEFTNMEIGIAAFTTIIQGALLYGFVKEISAVFTSWLFVSFIAIVGLAINFAYVSWFFDFAYTRSSLNVNSLSAIFN